MEIRKIFEEIRNAQKKGDRKLLTTELKTVMENRIPFYRHSVSNDLNDELSDLLFKALLLELDKEENDSIETAEMAYVGISNVVNNGNEGITFEHYKRRLLLIHYFADYFTDAVIGVFLEKYRNEHMLETRSMAFECLRKMLLSDLSEIERRFPEQIEKDEQLCEACNSIENLNDFSEEERLEAELMHKVLHAFLNVKYK
ncbi:hypothetical protein LJB85_01820 [Porphyromonadaceae bacterium OttesenSCG-928-L07]|nr:hypothetical protein [Porphyromonadaceae bacterium OttesenSCG-928-L07]